MTITDDRARRRLGVGVAAMTAAAVLVSGCSGSGSPPRAASPTPSTARTPHSTSSTTQPGVSPGHRPSRSGGTSPKASHPQPIPRPTGGAVLRRVSIASSDGFRPRSAYLYLPPSFERHPKSRLPVLELLHGTPGQPSDWLTRGLLLSTADAFASTHHGEAPIIVLPDLNGAERADSQCIRTKDGKDTESYLTGDVVAWVRDHYRQAVGRERFWVAGLSEGGVCSLMLALRHPQIYSSFGDFSGLARPIVDHLTVAESNRQLYGTDSVARREHDPLWLLKHRRYSDLRGWFECGAADTKVRAAQTEVVAAARAAHIPLHVALRPGRHVWTVWSAALRAMLPWLWRQR